MEFKRAAGLYIAGICLFFGGPLLASIATALEPWAAADLTGLLIGVAVFGILLGLIGLVMLVVAAYRALVKIDALPVQLPATVDHIYS